MKRRLVSLALAMFVLLLGSLALAVESNEPDAREPFIWNDAQMMMKEWHDTQSLIHPDFKLPSPSGKYVAVTFNLLEDSQVPIDLITENLEQFVLTTDEETEYTLRNYVAQEVIRGNEGLIVTRRIIFFFDVGSGDKPLSICIGEGDGAIVREITYKTAQYGPISPSSQYIYKQE